MEELPMKKGEGFFTKIKNFFRSLFSKKTETLEKTEDKNIENVEKNDEEIKPSFKETIQEDVQEVENRTSIIDEIEKNPDIIHTLSNEKLKELIKLYDEEIAKVDKEIQELKKQTNNV